MPSHHTIARWALTGIEPDAIPHEQSVMLPSRDKVILRFSTFASRVTLSVHKPSGWWEDKVLGRSDAAFARQLMGKPLNGLTAADVAAGAKRKTAAFLLAHLH